MKISDAKITIALTIISIAASTLSATNAHAATSEPDARFAKWAAIKTPSKTSTKIYGGYAGGCIAGAEALPLEGDGYLVLRSSRNRYYGHPTLITYLKSVAVKTKQAGLPKIMFGDMSAPRGGPFLKGHTSHQNGLDVDISYSFATSKMTSQERDSFVDPSMVIERKQVNDRWTSQQSKLVEIAAQAPEVARIFVAPGVKRHLCKLDPQAAWQYKVRSWWYHEDHLHVRLNCPAGSTNCEKQAALDPNNNGCGVELTDWLSKKADESQAGMDEHWNQPNPPPRHFANLPGVCADVRQSD